jgi:hypothetical protein
MDFWRVSLRYSAQRLLFHDCASNLSGRAIQSLAMEEIVVSDAMRCRQ